jgi:adenine deaminase
VDYDEALARLRVGLAILVRDGSTERNLEPILTGVVRDRLDTRHLMFCTDDKHPDDILKEGQIDYLVNRAIGLGIPPVQAIQMATLNAAVHFRCDHLLGSLSPGRWADVVLADSLDRIAPSHVFFKGRLVAQDGKLIARPPSAQYPDWVHHTVVVQRGKQAEDFQLRADGPTATVRVIELYPDQIINRIGQATLPVVDGFVVVDPGQDVLKLAVVERHGKNGNIGIAFVRGFSLQRGALASSVAHDHHNIIVVGTNDTDMAVCVRAIEAMQGGLVVAADGELLGQLALPVGGLMSEQPVNDVIATLEQMTAITHQLGCTLPAPFMTLSFISLPTVPELGLTDQGLVSVRDHAIISPFID